MGIRAFRHLLFRDVGTLVADLSFGCVATPRCKTKKECARFDNCPSANDPTPSDDELFAAYWKDQERTNFYAHGPAQIAQGLRNVFLLAFEPYKTGCRICNGTGWLHGAQSWTEERMAKGTPYKSIRCKCNPAPANKMRERARAALAKARKS